MDTDDIKSKFQESLYEVLELLDDDLKQIKSGRASNDIFDEIEVKAYGEMTRFGDLCQTIVRGQQLLTVKVYDESVKDEVLKSLTRSDMDIEVQMEGKDIRVKMGLGKKEHQAKALKQIKQHGEECRAHIRQVRHDIQDTLKKLSKILPKDEVTRFEDQIEKEVKKADKDCESALSDKTKEIESA